MQPNEPADAGEIKECRFCHVLIKEFDHGAGKEWLHIKTTPGLAPGQPYKICETYTVATPPETVGEWAGRLLDRKPE